MCRVNEELRKQQSLRSTVGASLILAVTIIGCLGATTSQVDAAVDIQQQQAANFLLFNNNNNHASVNNLLTNLTDSKLDGTSSSETVEYVWSKFADTVKQYAARKA